VLILLLDDIKIINFLHDKIFRNCNYYFYRNITLIFKKRRRQNSRRKNGHRQEYSMIRINKIFSKDGKVLSEAEKISKTSKKKEVKEAVSK